MVPFAYTIGSIRGRKWTSLAMAVGSAIVALVISSVFMIVEGIDSTLATGARNDVAVVLGPGAKDEFISFLNRDRIRQILTAPQIVRDGAGQPRQSTERLTRVGFRREGDRSVGVVAVRGVADEAFAFRPEVRIVAGRRFRTGSDEAIVGQQLPKKFPGTAIGQTVTLESRTLTIVGIFSADGSALESEVWCDMNTLAAGFVPVDYWFSVIRARLRSASDYDGFARFVQQGRGSAGPLYAGSEGRQGSEVVLRETEFVGAQSNKTSKVILLFGGIVTLLLCVGATLGAVITTHSAVANRRREIGVLRALGFSRPAVLFAFLNEILLICLVGGVLGAVGALALTQVEISMVNSTSMTDQVFALRASPLTGVLAALAAAALGSLGALPSAASAAWVPPVKTLRG
jgi:putative ABC transport system permease protein